MPQPPPATAAKAATGYLLRQPPQPQQSMSRVAHAYLQHAFKKAGRSSQFNKAHNRAQLSEKVRDNEWYKRWWRSFTKFFGGGHDQNINQTAFPKIYGEQSTSKQKNKAMKIQKIYGFIRLMSKLPNMPREHMPGKFTFNKKVQKGHETPKIPKWIKLEDFKDRDKTEYVGNDADLGPFFIHVAKEYVAIVLMVPKKSQIAKLQVSQKGMKQVHVMKADLVDTYRVVFGLKNDPLAPAPAEIQNVNNLPAFSKISAQTILNNDENDDAVNKIYKHIISYAKSLEVEQRQMRRATAATLKPLATAATLQPPT